MRFTIAFSTCVLRPILVAAVVFISCSRASAADPAEQHLLYVAAPGIRNYLQFGGAGILVFDMDQGHRFIKRMITPASRVEKPENIKGICAAPPPAGSISRP